MERDQGPTGLLPPEATVSQGRLVIERGATMTMDSLTPRLALRLLTLVLLVLALVDLAPASTPWRIAVGALLGLLLLWFMAVRIGGSRIHAPRDRKGLPIGQRSHPAGGAMRP